MRSHLCKHRRPGHGATQNRRRMHGDDTETRAQRVDLGEAVFRVKAAKKVRTWSRWPDGHTCAGALGFAATARRNVEHGHRWVKQGLGPSVACVCVRAERRWHGHGSDTKLMACTRQGNRERKTARNGPAALVGDIRRRTTSRVHECTCTGLAREDRTSSRWWCVRASRRRHSRGDGTKPTICTRQRDRNRVTTSGEVHTTKVCAHPTPGPRKAGPSLDGSVLSVWVPTASRNLACARRDKINTIPSEERARCGRQRHLQTTGSARWPALKRRRVCAAAQCGTAGDTHTASAQGSVQPRLEGRVHNKVKGVEAHLALLDTAAKKAR
jgi:hypothetical protein